MSLSLNWKLGSNLVRKIQLPIMLKMLNPKSDELILDAGCGTGNVSFEVKKKGSIVIGLDICTHSIKLAKLCFEYAGYTGYFIVGSATHLPFKSNIFDKILLSSVLQHVTDHLSVLREAHRVLKSNSVFVINVPCDRPYMYLSLIFRKSYTIMEKKLFEHFKAIHKYSLHTLKTMLNDTQFRIVSFEYSPKFLCSLIWEIDLLFKVIFRSSKWKLIRSILYVLTPVKFVLAMLDWGLPKRTIGSEIIMKAISIKIEA